MAIASLGSAQAPYLAFARSFMLKQLEPALEYRQSFVAYHATGSSDAIIQLNPLMNISDSLDPLMAELDTDMVASTQPQWAHAGYLCIHWVLHV
ncbi:hypothetical protein PENSUB_7977 [Penicillium subrubescens]|uniref:Uncharacterized protein n=1 Tax=Penicillium subrubescens TaxID=1316194 RepID=A0A1Q5TJX2_9EURO|nr:hypothetical protein PENSUB_7977 [Penicillium subrubescens]